MTPGKSLLLIFLTVLSSIVLLALFRPLPTDITCSMYHDAPLDKWWPVNSWKFPNITLEQFRSFPFPNGLIQSDAKFQQAHPSEIHIGDVLVFHSMTDLGLMAHRVIRKWEIDDRLYFSTSGDNAPEQFAYELKIGADQVLGKAIPKAIPNFRKFLFDPCDER